MGSVKVHAGPAGAQTIRTIVRFGLAWLVLGVSLLAGCGTPGGSPGPGPSSAGTGSIAQSPQLDRFRADCAAGARVDWRAAQVDYPKTLAATVGEGSVYEAAVDARDARPPADRVIAVDSGNGAVKQVGVKCRLAARLIPSSDQLTIDPAGDEWQYRDFSSTGVVQWAWTITPTKPAPQKLTLVVQPAVDLSGSTGQPLSSYGTGSNVEVRVFTDVDVHGTLVERVGYWFETQWPILVAIGTALLLVARPLWTWWQRKRTPAPAGGPGNPQPPA